MPILNMVGGGKKGGNIGEPLNLAVTTSGLDATITWEDNEIGTIPPTTFQKSELVRKVGSAPTSPSDGVLVVTETVKDTYKTTGYVDQGLTDGETYYYRVFSYSDLGGISYCDAVSVTPSSSWQPGANTLAYWKLNGNLNDSSGNNRNLTNAGGLTFATVDGVECAYYDGVGSGNCYAYCQTIPTPSVITINIWAKANNSWTGRYARGLFHTNCYMVGTNDGVRWEYYSGNSSPDVLVGSGIDVNDIVYNGVDYNSIRDKWCLWTAVYDNTTYKVDIYLNGQSYGSSTFSTHHPSGNWCGFFTLGTGFNATDSGITRKRYGWISDSIIEDKTRTAQEVADYYDQTKGNYGIS